MTSENRCWRCSVERKTKIYPERVANYTVSTTHRHTLSSRSCRMGMLCYIPTNQTTFWHHAHSNIWNNMLRENMKVQLQNWQTAWHLVWMQEWNQYNPRKDCVLKWTWQQVQHPAWHLVQQKQMREWII